MSFPDGFTSPKSTSGMERHIEYGRYVAAFPIDGERASVEQDENYRLARGKKCSEQLSLNVRDADIGT